MILKYPYLIVSLLQSSAVTEICLPWLLVIMYVFNGFGVSAKPSVGFCVSLWSRQLLLLALFEAPTTVTMSTDTFTIKRVFQFIPLAQNHNIEVPGAATHIVAGKNLMRSPHRTRLPLANRSTSEHAVKGALLSSMLRQQLSEIENLPSSKRPTKADPHGSPTAMKLTS